MAYTNIKRIACRVTAVAYEGADCWIELSSDDLPKGAPKIIQVANPPNGTRAQHGFEFLEGIRKNGTSIEIDQDFPETKVWLELKTGLIYVDRRESAWARIERIANVDYLRLLGKQK